MRCIIRLSTCVLAIFLIHTHGSAMVSRHAADVSRQFEHATAVFEGRVVGAHSFINQSGTIQTRFSIRVNQAHKGRLPAVVPVTLQGGVVGNVAESVGCQPNLAIGEDRLFFLSQDKHGAFIPTAGCASALISGNPSFVQAQREVERMSLTSPGSASAVARANPNSPLGVEGPGIQAVSSSATNLLNNGGIGARFLQPDQGTPIPYLVDADALPSEMSQTTALGAVSNALAAWEAMSSVRFEYQGLQSFGQAANTIEIDDGALRIQLHDLYGAISGSTTLGIGGRSVTIDNTPSDWTTGGQVFGNDFNKTTRGYVVLKHTKTDMQDALTFEEVLCHEVGHALSMDHSTPDTPATVGSPAWEAQMYYIAHEDGRGAFPTDWDANVLNQVHPIANTPPYTFARVMDVVTANPQPSVSGINEILIKGYDLQDTVTSVAVADATSGVGTFSTAGSLLQYLPTVVGTGPRSDPAGRDYFDYVYARCSDGVHASPHAWLRVISLSPDSSPTISDGIPNAWMTAKGWNVNPTVGTDHGAGDDRDGDGIINIDEYRSWMDPNSAASAQRVSAAPDGTVSWQGKAYELYELQGSTNASDWFFVKAVLPTNDTPTVRVDPSTYDSVVYRAFKVP